MTENENPNLYDAQEVAIDAFLQGATFNEVVNVLIYDFELFRIGAEKVAKVAFELAQQTVKVFNEIQTDIEDIDPLFLQEDYEPNPYDGTYSEE